MTKVYDLVDTDDWTGIEEAVVPPLSPIDYGATYFVEQSLVVFYQQLVAPYRLRVDNLTVSFWNGIVLSAVLHRCCPGRFNDFFDMKPSNARQNLCFACHHIRKLWHIEPPTSLNKKEMFLYLSKIFCYLQHTEVPAADIFLVKGQSHSADVPPSFGRRNVREKKLMDSTTERNLTRKSQTATRCGDSSAQTAPLNQERLEKADAIIFNPGGNRTSKGSLSHYRTHKLDDERLLRVDNMLRGRNDASTGACRSRYGAGRRPPIICRKLDPQEILDMERKLKLTALGCLLYHRKEPNISSKDAKIIAEKTSLLKARAQNGFKEPTGRFSEFDRTAKMLDQHLRLPNKTGAFSVAQLAKLHSNKIGEFASPKRRPPVPLPPQARQVPSGSELARRSPPHMQPSLPHASCMVCGAAVYLAERVCIENNVCHRECFRCAYCHCHLRLNGFGSEYIDALGKHIFCLRHLNLPLNEKIQCVTAGRTVEQCQKRTGTSSKPDSSAQSVERFQNQDQFESWYSDDEKGSIKSFDFPSDASYTNFAFTSPNDEDDDGGHQTLFASSAGFVQNQSDEIFKENSSSEEEPVQGQIKATSSMVDLRVNLGADAEFSTFCLSRRKARSLPSCMHA
ncbi:unnamed protein product [Soboliphyme baturini]|uniref:LIM zinc-binding domain-containing protein n=1 Tax=Soboliphyme baturini TaxID=241478 RepID=A0A183IPV4_9BILA|nr:unnamed protein product [Soboliphyme baturini]